MDYFAVKTLLQEVKEVKAQQKLNEQNILRNYQEIQIVQEMVARLIRFLDPEPSSGYEKITNVDQINKVDECAIKMLVSKLLMHFEDKLSPCVKFL